MKKKKLKKRLQKIEERLYFIQMTVEETKDILEEICKEEEVKPPTE